MGNALITWEQATKDLEAVMSRAKGPQFFLLSAEWFFEVENEPGMWLHLFFAAELEG